jgi:hypothetical protein
MWLRIFRNNPGNTKSGEAAATEDIPSGLAVWVEGIKSTVEYILLAVPFLLQLTVLGLVLSQYMALMATERRLG